MTTPNRPFRPVPAPSGAPGSPASPAAPSSGGGAPEGATEPAAGGGVRSPAGSNYGDWRPEREPSESEGTEEGDAQGTPPDVHDIASGSAHRSRDRR